ncbi:MAG TPA: efflux RND transporter periplasmic adaptor subunit [Burkholderiaceae bacterium]|jgi:multidrug efflux system membrane fusion protein|nr:efflux RND transporter periplasmic adaptor subunit [Burkholderiaceae bacterium]
MPAIALLVLLSAATWRLTKSDTTATPVAGKGQRGGDNANRPIPVATQPATIQPSFEVTLSALGTVVARNTVTVHVRVDGELVQVAFREGQMVHIGDLLALIDPRPFQVTLDNALATLEKDKAQLANAQVDLERYRSLIADDSIPKQQYDSQVALVQQDKALVLADQAQVDSARLQLSFTHVVSPINGRVGLRQVDLGNVVHAADANGLVVITQVQPIDIVFPIPQDRLPAVQRRVATGARMQVDAYDSDNRILLGTGSLLTTDNQIDTTTGTVKLKAELANRDSTLFPNQFVNVRLHLDQIDNALTIPSAAVQRGAPGLYAYVVKADNTVQIRPLKTGPTEGDRVQVLEGLAANDRVVVDGVDKLRDGAAVELIDPATRRIGSASGQVQQAGARAGAKKGSGSPSGAP